jgi:glycosyltransferase involved in cell wall biosynthesis
MAAQRARLNRGGMRALFVHQNFPGQYRHLAAHCARAGHQVVAIGERANLVRQPRLPGVHRLGYEVPQVAADAFNASVVKAIARGKQVAAAALALKRKGFVPDVICVHNGWGEGLFLKDIFPEARVLLYCEFFYRARGADTGFDPEYPLRAEQILRLRVMNAPLLMSLDASDWGVTPTRWQQRQFPAEYARRISVVHEGIDTDAACPSSERPGEEIITYVARNLEPYRGFHVFMRAIPQIQKRRPKARIVIVGGDEVSYSPRLPGGESYRQRMLREIDGKADLSRVTFTGRVSYQQYLNLLKASSVHVYLTYPFVLSWSLLDAMASECLVIASGTPPVRDVVEDGRDGLLVDFFDVDGLADRVIEACRYPAKFAALRKAARAKMLAQYDRKRISLPAWLAEIDAVRAGAADS